MPRTKLLNIDGCEIRIASLNLDQVDELFSKPGESDGQPVNKKTVILASLNRASPDNQWDEARYRAEFDVLLQSQVFDEVIAFSGLKPKEESPGGAGAASAISSAKSDAA